KSRARSASPRSRWRESVPPPQSNPSAVYDLCRSSPLKGGPMRRTLGLAAVLAVLLSGSSASTEPGPPPPPKATCGCTDPAFSGKCVENADVPQGATAQQACEAILQCLNAVDCLKTYCGATTVRGGWKLESAK